jgi:asparagine synthase (glutamine-hydrolysing)
MCGILGIYGKNIDENEVKRALDTISHRGPDASGLFKDKNIMLGHRRLSIIDLSKNGKQPMANENDDMFIIYNGELYNFQNLRLELEKKGHEFRSNSDTEVILHAYEEYGEKCVKKFNGMFAFAIWDAKKDKIFMARDRTGIKPLYYYQDKDKFVFAS